VGQGQPRRGGHPCQQCWCSTVQPSYW